MKMDPSGVDEPPNEATISVNRLEQFFSALTDLISQVDEQPAATNPAPSALAGIDTSLIRSSSFILIKKSLFIVYSSHASAVQQLILEDDRAENRTDNSRSSQTQLGYNATTIQTLIRQNAGYLADGPENNTVEQGVDALTLLGPELMVNIYLIAGCY